MSNGASVQVKPDQIDWTKDPFKSVNDAVAAEASRTAVAMKFLPPYGPLPSDHANGTVPADTIIVDNKAKTISVDSTATRPIIEIMVPFTLKQQQYDEENLNTAVTAATRAANLLAQAKDLICFQGNDKATIDFFNENPVVLQSDFPLPNNLVALLNPKPDNVIKVFPKENLTPNGIKYGEHTSSAVGRAYSTLQKKGHYGPYALVLHSDIYAATIESLEDTLIMPADRIKFFVTEMGSTPVKDEVRFYGTGALPHFTGLFMSLGGDTMDVVVASSPSTRYSAQGKGVLNFEVFESFALRLKDPTAVVLLEFATK